MLINNGMKKIILSLIIFGLFQLSYSQKKELKTIDKQIKAGDYDDRFEVLQEKLQRQQQRERKGSM